MAETPQPQDPTDDDRRGLGEFIREAWSQALAGVTAGEDEIQRIVSRVTHWFALGPEEARRLANDLTERLRKERGDFEANLDLAVRRAVAPFHLPTSSEVSDLAARVAKIEERLSKLNETRR